MIVTMHGKETVIGPIVSSALGLRIVRSHGVDTDCYGTFTGEVARVGSQRSTARLKAMAGFAEANSDVAVAFAIASEGTIRPDPSDPRRGIGDELVVMTNRD